MQRQNGLENKRVVVMGGSSGIGLAVAELSATHGAEVVIASSQEARIQQAISAIGGKTQGEVVDVSDERSVETFFTRLGAFDHLLFTAGDSLQLNELASTNLQQARHAFELRYWSAFASVKYGSKHIRKSVLSSSPLALPANDRRKDG
jgi:NAD(P)-dependent dehydrogenase (short-subunit alcohol dehydrogenase family)